MNTQDNNKTLEELEHVQKLLSESRSHQYFLKYESDSDFSDKMADLKSSLGSLEVPSVFSHFPVFPMDPSYYAATEKDKNSQGKLFKIALATAVVALILYLITKWEFLTFFWIVGVLGSLALGFFYSASKKEYIKKKGEYDKSMQKYNESYSAFVSALGTFEAEKEKCIASAKEYSERYSEAYSQHLSEFVDKIDKENRATERIEAIENELANNTAIAPQYYHLVGDIINNLKCGRADNYKEALNLAIREEKEEDERLARMEQEEQRTRIMEMQAEEERRHNEQLERQQRKLDEAMLREQTRMNNAMLNNQRSQQRQAQFQADKAASEARKQAQSTKMAGVSKCASCANSSKCPSHIKNSGAGLTCGGYVPYGAK